MILYGLRYIYKRLTRRFKTIGWPVAFESSVTIVNPQFISMGNSIFLGKNVILQITPEALASRKSHELIIEDKVTVGMGSWINAAERVVIRKNVLIGPNVFIADHRHKYSDIDMPVRMQGIDAIKPVVIEEGAWVGANAVINPGVRIGKNAVVGANSVVNRSIPDLSVAAGAPAKIIKRFNRKTKQWEKVLSLLYFLVHSGAAYGFV